MKTFILITFLSIGVHAQESSKTEVESVDEKQVQEFKDFQKWKQSQQNQESKEEPQPTIEKPKNPIRFSFGLGYMFGASEGKFDSVKATTATSSASGAASLGYSKVAMLFAEGRSIPQNAWGFSGGLEYEGERKFESGSVYDSSGTVNLTSSGSGSSRIRAFSFYGNAIYRWNEFYIPFGLNYSVVEFFPAAGSTGLVKCEGGLGTQVGVGFMINDVVSIELLSWMTTFKLKITQGTTVIDFGSGYFGSAILAAKFTFK